MGRWGDGKTRERGERFFHHPPTPPTLPTLPTPPSPPTLPTLPACPMPND
ncbi:hypothetical protein [Nostoc sp. DSM 114161]|jgi:hypothetical protein